MNFYLKTTKNVDEGCTKQTGNNKIEKNRGNFVTDQNRMIYFATKKDRKI